jgi:hypothetical protein
MNAPSLIAPANLESPWPSSIGGSPQAPSLPPGSSVAIFYIDTLLSDDDEARISDTDLLQLYQRSETAACSMTSTANSTLGKMAETTGSSNTRGGLSSIVALDATSYSWDVSVSMELTTFGILLLWTQHQLAVIDLGLDKGRKLHRSRQSWNVVEGQIVYEFDRRDFQAILQAADSVGSASMSRSNSTDNVRLDADRENGMGGFDRLETEVGPYSGSMESTPGSGAESVRESSGGLSLGRGRLGTRNFCIEGCAVSPDGAHLLIHLNSDDLVAFNIMDGSVAVLYYPTNSNFVDPVDFSESSESARGVVSGEDSDKSDLLHSDRNTGSQKASHIKHITARVGVWYQDLVKLSAKGHETKGWEWCNSFAWIDM